MADLRRMVAPRGSRTQILGRSIPRVCLQPRYRAVVVLRLAQRLHRHAVLRFYAIYLQGRILRMCGAEIHPAAIIGPGLQLVHSSGIVIGHEVAIGSMATIYHGVTLGHDSAGEGQPVIGDGVRLGSGATVLGPIRIGNGAQIGAGALVLADVPAYATVVGVWKG